MPDLVSLIFFLALIGVLVMPACGATVFAAETAPRGRHGRMHSGHLVAGAWVAAAGTAQSRARYLPQARPGALVVRLDPARPALGIAAVRQELPGTDVAQGLTPVHPFDLTVSRADSATSSSRAYIGDQALLRYLTGDPSFPYDEGRAVAVTSEPVRHDTVTIEYSAPEDPPGDSPGRSRPRSGRAVRTASCSGPAALPPPRAASPPAGRPWRRPAARCWSGPAAARRAVRRRRIHRSGRRRVSTGGRRSPGRGPRV
ncbi:hypothetical protein ACIBQ6_50060 [Nonomuraea sp. NPDC049655]|uniref:hypothetical protein n=1 Tax=Nonomuraea sp. NPDC049655 TaxID=3364355 RepID=UPI0037A4927A